MERVNAVLQALEIVEIHEPEVDDRAEQQLPRGHLCCHSYGGCPGSSRSGLIMSTEIEKENSNNAYNFVMVQFIVYDSNY